MNLNPVQYAVALSRCSFSILLKVLCKKVMVFKAVSVVSIALRYLLLPRNGLFPLSKIAFCIKMLM